MEQIQVKCEHCGNLQKIPAVYQGKRIKCPSCKKLTLVKPYSERKPQKDAEVVSHRKLATCRHCGGKVSPEAQTCPHCGLKYPSKSAYHTQIGATIIACLIVGGLLLYVFHSCSEISEEPIIKVPKERSAEFSTSEKNEKILRRRLAYLMEIPEVKWVEFDDNTVYIGFDPYPANGSTIIRAAAFHGNKAINFGCHVWAVPADQIGNPPWYGTMSGKWYDEVTARYGQVR